MARIPVTIQQNPANGPSSQISGPAQPRMVYQDRKANDLQGFQRTATAPVKALPFANGNMLAGVSFTANTALRLQHNLGRAYVGFFACNFVGAAGTVFRTDPTNATLRNTTITLTCSATCTADVWIY